MFNDRNKDWKELYELVMKDFEHERDWWSDIADDYAEHKEYIHAERCKYKSNVYAEVVKHMELVVKMKK
jgi:hypothetical protein